MHMHPSPCLESSLLWSRRSSSLSTNARVCYPPMCAELPLLKQEDVPAFDYPASVRYQQCAWCIFSVLCMFAALMLTWKLALLVMSPLPSTLQVREAHSGLAVWV